MGILFQRRIILEVGPAGGEGRRWEKLRIAFDVKMPATSEPNTAKIQVYNPGKRSIGFAQDPDAVFRLLVGYDYNKTVASRVERLIFQGNPIKNGVWLEKTGPDRILHLELADGLRRYQLAFVNLSWSREVGINQVLQEVLGELELPKGTVELPNDTRWPQGLALAGPARNILDRLASTQNAQWFIRDGVFYMLTQDGVSGERYEQAPVFSSLEGKRNLIGSPKPTDAGLEITALLSASMRPGRRFRLESKDYNGIYKAADVQMKGDLYTKDFYVTIKGATPSV